MKFDSSSKLKTIYDVYKMCDHKILEFSKHILQIIILKKRDRAHIDFYFLSTKCKLSQQKIKSRGTCISCVCKIPLLKGGECFLLLYTTSCILPGALPFYWNDSWEPTSMQASATISPACTYSIHVYVHFARRWEHAHASRVRILQSARPQKAFLCLQGVTPHFALFHKRKRLHYATGIASMLTRLHNSLQPHHEGRGLQKEMPAPSLGRTN